MPHGDDTPNNDNRTRDDTLDEITDLVARARQLAEGLPSQTLVYLLGMALLEIGDETVRTLA